jgi:FkbM family methyltransferase
MPRELGVAVKTKKMRRLEIGRCCDHTFVRGVIDPRSVVLDLGVYKGEFATWITDYLGCSVYGAEPDPSHYYDFGQSKSIRVVSCAVGGQRESAVLRRASGKCSTIFAGAFKTEDRLTVSVVSFEDFLSCAGLDRHDLIDLVKVDIEGAECPMFEEASDAALQRVGQFTVEFHDFIWPELRERVSRVKSRLRSLGFRSINFSLDNSDVLFLNRRLLNIGLFADAYLRTIKYANGIKRAAERIARSA